MSNTLRCYVCRRTPAEVTKTLTELVPELQSIIAEADPEGAAKQKAPTFLEIEVKSTLSHIFGGPSGLYAKADVKVPICGICVTVVKSLCPPKTERDSW